MTLTLKQLAEEGLKDPKPESELPTCDSECNAKGRFERCYGDHQDCPVYVSNTSEK